MMAVIGPMNDHSNPDFIGSQHLMKAIKMVKTYQQNLNLANNS